MLGLAPLLNELSFGQDPSIPNGVLQGGPETQTTGNSLRVRAPHFAPKAKRMVHFFLNGGPSHVDTFDPKPKLLEYAGKPLPTSYLTERRTGGALPSPFAFKKYGQSGLEISELFQRTAEHADNIAVIRSMAHRMIVMQGGHVVEAGDTEDVFETPQHPYTRRLLDAALLSD